MARLFLVACVTGYPRCVQSRRPSPVAAWRITEGRQLELHTHRHHGHEGLVGGSIVSSSCFTSTYCPKKGIKNRNCRARRRPAADVYKHRIQKLSTTPKSNQPRPDQTISTPTLQQHKTNTQQPHHDEPLPPHSSNRPPSSSRPRRPNPRNPSNLPPQRPPRRQ